jgi:hypothetical protein
MRIVIAIVVTAVVVAFAVYLVMPSKQRSQYYSAKPQIEARGRDLSGRLTEAVIRHQAVAARDLRQDKTEGRLEELDDRVRNLEAKGERDEDEEVGKDPAARKTTIAETDLASWLDSGLRVERPDAVFTAQARTQVLKNLEQIPGVKLDAVDCTSRFCRATFAQQDGKPPVIRELFGLPPVTSEGFTLEGADGRVALYFTRAGESLQGLRGEALAAASP